VTYAAIDFAGGVQSEFTAKDGVWM